MAILTNFRKRPERLPELETRQVAAAARLEELKGGLGAARSAAEFGGPTEQEYLEQVRVEIRKLSEEIAERAVAIDHERALVEHKAAERAKAERAAIIARVQKIAASRLDIAREIGEHIAQAIKLKNTLQEVGKDILAAAPLRPPVGAGFAVWPSEIRDLIDNEIIRADGITILSTDHLERTFPRAQSPAAALLDANPAARPKLIENIEAANLALREAMQKGNT